MSGQLAGARALVTGAAGYVGAAVVDELLAAGAEVVRLARGQGRFAPRAGARDLDGDVRERSAWRTALEGADLVVHLAAQTSLARGEAEPSADLATNVAPVLHLLEECAAQGRRPAVLLAGTVTQVGVTRTVPVSEAHEDRPVTVYDQHKLVAEWHLLRAARAGALRGACLRLANVYGPGPTSGSPDRGILNAMVVRALAGGALTIHGEGRSVRDYVFVGDVARAFVAAGVALLRGAADVDGQKLLVGSGRGRTIAEAVELVAGRVEAATGRRPAVTHVPPPGPRREIDERDFVADTTRLRIATGWRATVDLPEGIDRMIEASRAARRGP